jgi:hypothetical protein
MNSRSPSPSSDAFLRRITVYMRYENVVRLLEFLGYRLE